MTNSLCKLNNRINVLRLEEVPDSVGGVDIAYVPDISLWARLKPLDYKAGESWQSGALDLVNEYKVTVRVGKEIKMGSRIEWKRQLFEMRTPPAYTEDKKFQVFTIRSLNQDRVV